MDLELDPELDLDLDLELDLDLGPDSGTTNFTTSITNTNSTQYTQYTQHTHYTQYTNLSNGDSGGGRTKIVAERVTETETVPSGTTGTVTPTATMDMHDMSAEVTAADTAAEVATDAAAADPANRTQKKSSQTCTTCRARKVRCDGRRDVCQNCERLGFSCSFQDKSSPNPDSDITSFSLPRRRVRLACINCHSRKARCSGETPKCTRCQAQGIECVYRPTKRSGGVNGTGTGSIGIGIGIAHSNSSQRQGTTDSDHESIASEPPEKRQRRDDRGSVHSRGASETNTSGNNNRHETIGTPISRRPLNDRYVVFVLCVRSRLTRFIL